MKTQPTHHKIRLQPVRPQTISNLNPLCAALVVAGLILLPTIVQAQDWNGGTGLWTTPNRWNSNAVPTATSTAKITIASDSVLLQNTGEALNVELDGKLKLDSGGSLAVGDAIKIGVLPIAGTPELLIEGASTVSAVRVFVGDATNRTGQITVSGANSNLTVAPTNTTTGRFLMGGNGNGTLLIRNAGTATVNGTGVLHLGSTGTGTLSIGDSGSAAGSLTANSVVTGNAASSINFNHTGTATFSAPVSGTGKVSTNNAGTTTLRGTNTYTGGTTLNNTSTLVGTTSSLQGDIVANTGTTVKFNQSTNGTFAGVLTSGGALVKEGTGNATLTGANTYSGGTTVSGGTLTGTTSSLQGNITNNAAVVIDQAGAGMFAGVISGAGNLTKLGTGNATLTGANTYSGGTTVSGGTLTGTTTTLQGNITNNAAVVFDQTAAGTYAGIISGAGGMTKTGAGDLKITGSNTFTGATNINAGTLSVNGSLASTVSVNSGGTLGGSGTVGTTTINSGGVFAPGNSIGTTTVNGGLTFAAGSIYRVEIDAAGNNDRINVVGAPGRLAINGGTVNVQAGAGNYAPTTRYTIINAVGGRTGEFNGVNSNLAFLTPTLGYDANNVFLLIARNGTSYSDVAITPNQIAVSGALQNASTGASGDMLTVINAVHNLTAAQARTAFDAIGGASLSEARANGPNFSASFAARLQSRLGAVSSTPAGALVAHNGGLKKGAFLLAASDSVADLLASPMLSDAPSSNHRAGGTYALGAVSSSRSNNNNQGNHGFWLRSFSLTQTTDSDGNAAANRFTHGGLNAGYDFYLDNGLTVGAALTFGSSKSSFAGTLDAGKSNDAGAALYMGYNSGPWNFSGSVSLTQQKIHMDRFISVGSLNRVAASDFASRTLAAFGQATYDIAMEGWTLQPSAAVSMSRNASGGLIEQGAGALNLQVAAQTARSLKSQIGAKGTFTLGALQIEPRVLWSHEFGDVNSPISAHFPGGLGAGVITPFQIAGVALTRNATILGLSVSGEVTKDVRFFGDVQAERSARQRKASVLMGLRAKW